jgi:hypothetical protein
LAGHSKGRLLHPLMVDGTDDVHSLGLGGGEVNHNASLYLERQLEVVLFDQLGLDGRLLADKFASLLRSPVLGVNLPSIGSRLLLLLAGLLLLRREPDICLLYDSL